MAVAALFLEKEGGASSVGDEGGDGGDEGDGVEVMVLFLLRFARKEEDGAILLNVGLWDTLGLVGLLLTVGDA